MEHNYGAGGVVGGWGTNNSEVGEEPCKLNQLWGWGRKILCT